MCMIGVISGYRTGSTTLIEGLARLFNLNYSSVSTGELDFSHSHYYTPHRNDIIYKLMPCSMGTELESPLWQNIQNDWLSKSTLIFTLRHDISAQIKSYALANASAVWHQSEADISIQNYNDHHDCHFETIDDINVDIAMNLTEDMLDEYIPHFIQNLQMQKELYETHGGLISLLEDRFEGKLKYKLPLVLPEHLQTWHCGFSLEDYFPYK